MLSRKEQLKPGSILPAKWAEKVESVLYGVYKDQCVQQNKTFQVHGLTYPDELFLAVGLFNPKELLMAPVTYVISMDLDDKNQDPGKYLDTLIDSMGIFFDSYFADSDWNDYISNWTEAKYKDLEFQYKVSRENIALSIKAEALLNQ
ncbi:MAG: hypothetical protein K9K67_09220 [Bacteriovoracaceae bacterium]|nr:hypothetical protein [Bacteriovoracaceae bacterium]